MCRSGRHAGRALQAARCPCDGYPHSFDGVAASNMPRKGTEPDIYAEFSHQARPQREAKAKLQRHKEASRGRGGRWVEQGRHHLAVRKFQGGALWFALMVEDGAVQCSRRSLPDLQVQPMGARTGFWIVKRQQRHHLLSQSKDKHIG